MCALGRIKVVWFCVGITGVTALVLEDMFYFHAKLLANTVSSVYSLFQFWPNGGL